jgi:hypothetical protein
VLFYNAKSVFLAVHASVLSLNNVSGMYCAKSMFPCFLLVSRVWDIYIHINYIYIQILTLASHWLDDCAWKFTPMLEENGQYSAKHSWCNTSNKAIPLSAMNNYTPLVISRNEKNNVL